MQLLSTPDLKAVAWTPPASSADIHFKDDLDGGLDGAGAVTHADVTAISGLTADFVSLAESVLMLAGSEETCRPDQDGDGNASLSLTKLRDLKTDAERTLERSAMMLSAPAEPFKKLNLIDGGLEMKLVFLSVELSKVIDEVLKGRLQAQKDRNTQIQNLNELVNGLRKLQKSKDDFKAEDLDKDFKSFPPDSPFLKKAIERARKTMEQGKTDANATAKKILDDIVADAIYQPWIGTANDERFALSYKSLKPDDVTSDADGNVLLWKKNNDGSWSYRKETLHDKSSWYPNHWTGELKDAFAKKNAAINTCEIEFERSRVSGKASLSDLLCGYGIYKDGEKLPATKEELEAATEKISAMVSSINSTQTLKMLDIDKFTNGRNEAFSLAVKVNNSKVDNLNAIIRQIGERQ